METPNSGVYLMSTKLLPCSCSHRFQDEEYGKGQRVHNATGSESTSFLGEGESAIAIRKRSYRCTVCGKVRG